MSQINKKTYLAKRLARLKQELRNAATVRSPLINDDSAIQNTPRDLDLGTRALLQQLY